MCYIKTGDKNNLTYNPCYACHINSEMPKYVDDISRQEEYSFSANTLKNRFSNLFLDRSTAIDEIILAKILQNIPSEWDVDANGSLDTTQTDKFEDDISYLIFPLISRALELNKAYKVIVEEQTFIYGCAGHIQPLKNVYKELEEVKPTGLEVIRRVE